MCRTSVVLVLTLLAACGAQANEPKPDGGEVVEIAAHDISPPLRDLAALDKYVHRDDDEIEESEPARRIPHPHMHAQLAPNSFDAVSQTELGATPIPAPTASFEGLGAGIPGFTPGGVPPDTDGDIGPNHYVEVVNTSMAVFTRTGTIAMGPMDTGAVWAGFTGACATTNDGDAVVRYDHIADRWVIAQFSLGAQFAGPFYQCVAVSTTPDPTGTYARYQFNYNALNDYPKVGLWPDGYYFTFNMFPDSGFAGAKICAMDRVKMLAGDPAATMQCFDTGPDFGGVLASDVDGKTPPPAGAPNYLVTLNSQTDLAYWKLHVDFTTPTASTLTGPTNITVSSFDPLCGGSTCVTEPTGGSQLDSLADRPMNRFVYRRFADHESLLFSHSVTAGAGGGVRWYELRTPDAPTMFQQGTYAPDGAFRWMPSVAMDGAGDIAAIFTVASSTINPSIRFTGRQPSDPPGTFGMGEGRIVDGAGTQTQISRWGDYASLNIDPVDDCTFWGANEYKKATGRSNWNTRIASFTLPTCSSFAFANPDAEMVDVAGKSTYPIATNTTAGAPQSLTLTATGLPAGVTATFAPATMMSGETTMITLKADKTAVIGMYHYTIVAAGPTSSAMTDIALTVNPKGTSGGGDDGGCCEVGGNPPMGSLLLAGAVLLVIRRRRR